MKSKNTTLKDIAEYTNTNVYAVHCALNQKPGVRKEVREKIIEAAKILNYQPNYVASSLKRKTLNIFTVFPNPIGDNSYYYSYYIVGAKKFFDTVTGFNLNIHEITYNGSPEIYSGEALEKLWKEHGTKIDGVICIGTTEEKAMTFFKNLEINNIPLCILNDDIPSTKRLCCIRPDAMESGSVAADLCQITLPTNSSVFVCAGSPSIQNHIYNYISFENTMQKYGNSISIIKNDFYHDQNQLAKVLEETLLQDKNIAGVYACNARSTQTVCKTLTKLKLNKKIIVIGSDAYKESQVFWENKALNVAINKSPEFQSFKASQILFNYLVKNQSPENPVILSKPSIVLPSNSQHGQ